MALTLEVTRLEGARMRAMEVKRNTTARRYLYNRGTASVRDFWAYLADDDADE